VGTADSDTVTAMVEPDRSPLPRRLTRGLRRKAGSLAADGFFQLLSRAGRLHPGADPRRHGVTVVRDVPYLDDGRREHLLDIYHPAETPPPWPALLYVHGGGFRILSKDTHWVMGLAFARRGFSVFNINYRLAPRHPFPAALEDVCAAWAWLVHDAGARGTTLEPAPVLAGESAGANLVTALTLACCYRRPEPWARRVWDLGRVPAAVLPACGMLQVSDPERFWRRRKLPVWLRDRLGEPARAYLGPAADPGAARLADPLLVLERGQPPQRPLPPFFAAVGTRDPLLDDTRRLKAALDRLEVPCEARYYPGEMHAFNALVWRPNARRSWKHTFKFLEHHGLLP
jgi:acetyl esterase